MITVIRPVAGKRAGLRFHAMCMTLRAKSARARSCPQQSMWPPVRPRCSSRQAGTPIRAGSTADDMRSGPLRPTTWHFVTGLVPRSVLNAGDGPVADPDRLTAWCHGWNRDSGRKWRARTAMGTNGFSLSGQTQRGGPSRPKVDFWPGRRSGIYVRSRGLSRRHPCRGAPTRTATLGPASREPSYVASRFAAPMRTPVLVVTQLLDGGDDSMGRSAATAHTADP